MCPVQTAKPAPFSFMPGTLYFCKCSGLILSLLRRGILFVIQVISMNTQRIREQKDKGVAELGPFWQLSCKGGFQNGNKLGIVELVLCFRNSVPHP